MMKKIISLLLICVLFLVGTNIDAYCSDVKQGTVAIAYDETSWCVGDDITFPVSGKSQEWKTFQTHDDMIAACNMPTALLMSIETSELVELMLKYPLLGDLLLYDNIEAGIEVMSYTSNILAEILGRSDGASELLQAYSDFNVADTMIPVEIQSKLTSENISIETCLEDQELESRIEQDRVNLSQCIFLEAILTKDDVLNNLTDMEVMQLSKIANEKFYQKEKSNLYTNHTYLFYDMIKCAKTSSEKLKQMQYTPSNNTRDITSYVKTPNGSKVPTIVRTYDAALVASECEYIDENYPNVQVLRSGTTNYNCHSYAWYNQSTSNVYWMNDPSLYITDGSYTQVGTSPTATGQRVCYTVYGLVYPYVHSGIVYSISGNSIMITSKWGAGYLVRHNATYSPYAGTRFYFQR